MSGYFSDPGLIRQVPILRAAYSDRTAWILAEISRLVYEKLPSEIRVDELVRRILESARTNKGEAVVRELVAAAIENGQQVDGVVASTLEEAGFELLEGIAVQGCEAILVRLNFGVDPQRQSMIVLAFRGTQVSSIRDISTDLRANLVAAPGGGRAHAGFLAAFEKVRDRLESALARYPGLPLYLTGHSLGAALALVATRYLGSDSTGATYTFGCPRAGDDHFFAPIRTPIYRVVNAADGVTRIPFGYSLVLLLSLIRLIPINGTFRIAEFLRRQFFGYTHAGSIVFLSDAPNIPDDQQIPFRDLQVEMSPEAVWRFIVVVRRFLLTGGKAVVADHSMSDYALKLFAQAKRRNA
ncbi:MAG: lipase [Cyanobium sp. CACIAM 14]|nr:MAG: lipase [Cyanobium sp. CACIAM 14]